MKIEYLALEKLTPYPRNPRKNHDLEAISSSLLEYGWRQPIVVDTEGVIIIGHGRYYSAKKLLAEGHGEFGAVPVHVAGNLTPAQIRGLRIADNKSQEKSEWDLDLLNFELGELREMNFDLELTGWSMDEISGMRQPVDGLTDPDEVPDPPKKPKSKPGDIWCCGEHRVMCGDSTHADEVALLMDGGKADLVLTDPPYGMRLDTNYAAIKKANPASRVKGNSYNPVIGDDCDFDPTFILEYFNYCPEIFLWGADYYHLSLPSGGSWFVWDKRNDALNEFIGNDFELCWSKTPHKKRVMRLLWAGYNARERNERRAHPTQKPIELMKRFLDSYGMKNDTVIDLFGGSGSTLIACEKTGRTCRMMEIDPHYVDVIITRWQNFTGKKATRIHAG